MKKRIGHVVADAAVMEGTAETGILLYENLIKKKTDHKKPFNNDLAKKSKKGSAANFCPEHKAFVLERGLNALESAGLKPFLCFVLLLGHAREQRFMPDERDLDIGLFYDENLCEEVKSILVGAGFRIAHYEKDPWPCRLKAQLSYNSILLEIVFFKPTGAYLQTYSRILNHVLIRNRTPFSLKRDIFEGLSVRVPDPPEIFLDENYNKWRIKSDYHHYILTSPLTDFSDLMVRFLLTQTLYKTMLSGNVKIIDKLIQIGKLNYRNDEFWGEL